MMQSDKSKKIIIFCAVGVRAYNGARILKQNGFENVKIYAVDIVESGKLKVDRDIIIPCREGAVRILELQVPGKKRMDVRSFLNGLH